MGGVTVDLQVNRRVLDCKLTRGFEAQALHGSTFPGRPFCPCGGEITTQILPDFMHRHHFCHLQGCHILLSRSGSAKLFKVQKGHLW